jgi:hypothetical protein
VGALLDEMHDASSRGWSSSRGEQEAQGAGWARCLSSGSEGGLKLEGNHLKGGFQDVPLQNLRGIEMLEYLEAWRACESGEGLKESLRGFMRLEEGLKA